MQTVGKLFVVPNHSNTLLELLLRPSDGLPMLLDFGANMTEVPAGLRANEVVNVLAYFNNSAYQPIENLANLLIFFICMKFWHIQTFLSFVIWYILQAQPLSGWSVFRQLRIIISAFSKATQGPLLPCGFCLHRSLSATSQQISLLRCAWSHELDIHL